MAEEQVVEAQTENVQQSENEPDTTDPAAYAEPAPEPEAEGPAEAEAVPEPEDGTLEPPGVPRQIEQNGQKYVTLEALREERIKNRERQEAHERRLKEMEERFIRTQRDLSPEPQDPIYDIPDPSEDVIGATAAIREEMLRQREEQAHQQQQTAQQAEQQRLTQHIQNQTISQVAAYKKEHPEYDEAFGHLRQNREGFYRAMGYDDAAVAQVLQQEEFNIAYQLVGRGQNVPEAVMEMARQVGWKPKAVQQGEDKVKQVAEGQRQAAPARGGNAPDGEKDIKWLASLSEEEFSKLSDVEFRRIMGG